MHPLLWYLAGVATPVALAAGFLTIVGWVDRVEHSEPIEHFPAVEPFRSRS